MCLMYAGISSWVSLLPGGVHVCECAFKRMHMQERGVFMHVHSYTCLCLQYLNM